MKQLCESMAPLDLNPGTGATSRVCSSLVRCFNGPKCKWHSVGVCRYRHDTSEHDIVTKKHDQSDAPGRLSRIMDELEQILQLLQGAARDFCGQERMGDKTEEPGVPGELIAKPVNSDVSRGCEVLAISEWQSGRSRGRAQNRRGPASVRTRRASRTIRSNAHTEQSRRHGTAERGTGWSRRVQSYVKHGFVVKAVSFYGNGETCVGPAPAPDAEPGLCCTRGNRLK